MMFRVSVVVVVVGWGGVVCLGGLGVGWWLPMHYCVQPSRSWGCDNKQTVQHCVLNFRK